MGLCSLSGLGLRNVVGSQIVYLDHWSFLYISSCFGFYASYVPWSPKVFSFASTTWLLVQATYISSYPRFPSAFFSDLIILNFDLKGENCGAFSPFTLRTYCRIINYWDNTIFFSWDRSTEERKDQMMSGKVHRLDTQIFLSLTSQKTELGASKTTAVVTSKI